MTVAQLEACMSLEEESEWLAYHQHVAAEQQRAIEEAKAGRAAPAAGKGNGRGKLKKPAASP